MDVGGSVAFSTTAELREADHDQLPDDLHNLRPSPASDLLFLLALAAALGLVVTALLAMT